MEETLKLSNSLFQHKINYYKAAIILTRQVFDIVSKHMSSRPFHLNVIEAACKGHFKETGHSLVLADLLRHPLIQSSFIMKFLNIQHEYMVVTAEKDRVDVALRGNDIFVIVENKVNAADEQENQVYRYVHEIGMGKYKFELSQIYVVYLNPHNRALPSAYSLCDSNQENNVFEALGKKHYTVLSYKYDITNWLRELTIHNEPHISSALDQYIDFLENKFHTSQFDKNMNNEIKDLILKELHIEGKSFQEQMSALDDQRDKINELLSSIDDLQVELRLKESNKMMREWQSQIEEQHKISLAHDEHSFGVQLKNHVWLGVWDGYDSQEKLPYWGFQLANYKKSEMPDLLNCIEELLKKVEFKHYKTEEKYFIAWCTTQNGVKRFLSLYQGAKDLGLIELSNFCFSTPHR